MHIQCFCYTIIWYLLLNIGIRYLTIIYQIGREKYLNIFPPKYAITLIEWNHDKDHVHILFKAHPKTSISKFINAYKSASSRLLKKEFPQIRKKLWKGHFWSQSFCLLTTGGASIDVIKKYIESQGQKPKRSE